MNDKWPTRSLILLYISLAENNFHWTYKENGHYQKHSLSKPGAILKYNSSTFSSSVLTLIENEFVDQDNPERFENLNENRTKVRFQLWTLRQSIVLSRLSPIKF